MCNSREWGCSVLLLHQSHKLHCWTFICTPRGSEKDKEKLEPKRHLPKQLKECFTTWPAPEHRDVPFQGCFEKEDRRKLWKHRRWLGQMLMAGLSPPAPPPASLHSAWVQSFTVDFFQAISSNYWWPAWDTFICIKLKLDLECAMGASIPSKAPDVLGNAQRTMTPLCSPRWNRGKPLLRA